MSGILRAAAEVSWRIDELGIPHCIIGGIALQRWGEPRMTVGVDVTVLAGFGNELETFRKLSHYFAARILNAESFAQNNRIALLKTAEGIGVDVSLGALPFEQRVIDRSSCWAVNELGTIRTCSADDLVILKAFAARPQDWIDIGGIITRQGDQLDQRQIFDELTPLVELKEEPEILTHLQQLFT